MLLIARGKKMFTEDLIKVHERVKVLELFKMLALILGVNAIISLATLLFLVFAESMGISPNDSSISIMESYMDPTGVLYVVLLGPIFEEIIFRGAILRTLLPYGQNFAIVLSALLFGLYHLMITQGVFAFFVGLILAYCTLRYSIKWAMLLHIANNGLAMLMMFFVPSLAIEFAIYMLYLGLALVAGILGFAAFRAQLRAGKPVAPLYVPGLPPAKPMPWAISFTSAWLIVGLTLATIISIAMVFL
jgi:hypothetical protein